MKLVLILVLSSSAVACASNPVAERVDREYRRGDAHVLATEKFDEWKRNCARAGGAIRVHRSSSGRFPPTTDEIRLATCGPRP